MKTLLIVWHSRTGGAQAMAEAAASAASEISVRMLSAAETTPSDILAADGYIFAAPENLATLSGPMKDFFDRCYPFVNCIVLSPMQGLIRLSLSIPPLSIVMGGISSSDYGGVG